MNTYYIVEYRFLCSDYCWIFRFFLLTNFFHFMQAQWEYWYSLWNSGHHSRSVWQSAQRFQGGHHRGHYSWQCHCVRLTYLLSLWGDTLITQICALKLWLWCKHWSIKTIFNHWPTSILGPTTVIFRSSQMGERFP